MQENTEIHIGNLICEHLKTKGATTQIKNFVSNNLLLYTVIAHSCYRFTHYRQGLKTFILFFRHNFMLNWCKKLFFNAIHTYAIKLMRSKIAKMTNFCHCAVNLFVVSLQKNYKIIKKAPQALATLTRL